MATASDLNELVEIFAGACKPVFSAARAFLGLKFTTFGLAVTDISEGLPPSEPHSYSRGAGWGTFDLELSESNTLQVVAELAVTVLIANFYFLDKSRQHEIKLAVKVPPSLRKKLRASIEPESRDALRNNAKRDCMGRAFNLHHWQADASIIPTTADVDCWRRAWLSVFAVLLKLAPVAAEVNLPRLPISTYPSKLFECHTGIGLCSK